MRQYSEAYVLVTCTRIGGISGKAETENAVMIEVGDREIWIPFDHCQDIQRNANPPQLYVARWLAKREGLL